MTLGQKIKQARLDRNMTQKDVVGDYITRNMLSKIENGSATPSIKTLEYLADMLGLPPGYFMADLPPESAASGIDGARTAYRRGDYKRAIELLTSSDRGTLSDEACLLSAKCCAGLARKAYKDGDLPSARAYAREGLKHCSSGIYTDPHSEVECCEILMLYALRTPEVRDTDYERYAERLDAALDLEGLAQRAALISALRDGEIDGMELSPDELSDHWARAMWYLLYGRAAQNSDDAVALLLEAEREAELDGGKLLCGDVYSALELVYSSRDDYKQAYEYATKRLGL